MKRIPHFPLDISIAAKYIENYKLSPQEYLSALDKQDASFLEAQQDLLKDGGDYRKTRYEIITLSIKKIIDQDRENLEKLLMLSLMDSQNIPKEMLNRTSTGEKHPMKADKFIGEMMRHSLITMGTAAGDVATVSLHRSTWEVMYAYLVNSLKLSPSHPLVRKVIRSMADYVYAAIDDENRPILVLLEPHGKRISTSELLTVDEQMKVTGMLGCIYYYPKQGKEAQELLEKSISYIELNMPRDKHRLARLYMHLGLVYRLNCKYTEAEEYLKKAQIAFAQSKAPEKEAICAANLAYFYYGLGEYFKAKSLVDNYIQDLSSIGSSAKYKLLKTSALIERELGNYQEALIISQKTTTYYGSRQKDVTYAWCLAYESLIYREIGNIFNASDLMNKAIEIHQNFDKTTYMYQWLILYRASIYRMQGNFNKATNDIDACIKFFESDSSINLMSLSYIKAQRSKVYRNTGYLDKALAEAKEAEKLYIDLFGERNLRTSWIRMTLGQIYNDQGNYAEARKILQECLDVHRTMLKESHPKIGKILSELGYAQVKLGDIKNGQANLEAGLKNYEAHYGKDHLRTAYVLRLMSECLETQGDLKGAEEAAQRAYTISQKANHPDQALCLERVGDVRISAGIAAGKEDLKKALALAETRFGSDSPYVKRIKEKL